MLAFFTLQIVIIDPVGFLSHREAGGTTIVEQGRDDSSGWGMLGVADRRPWVLVSSRNAGHQAAGA